MKYLLYILIFVPIIIFGQGSTGWKSPGTAENITGFGANAWLNPTRATASDNSRAYCSANPPNEFVYSNYLRCSNYSIDIPEDSVVVGIEFRIEKQCEDYYHGDEIMKDTIVRLVIGGTITGSNYKSALAWPDAVDGTITYGGATDLWGTTISVAEVEASTFGIVLAVKMYDTGLNTGAYVDVIQVNVHYDAPPPAPAVLNKNVFIGNNF